MISLKKAILYTLSIFLFGCVDPVRPEYDFIDGLIFIDAIASTSLDASFVKISQSVVLNGRNHNEFVEGAIVVFVNTETNDLVYLNEEEEIYVPPGNFIVNEGEIWELDITLSDGKKYRSLPEKVLESIEINNVKATYNPELLYDDALGEYVPGHSILVDFNDPSEENFYYWSFRSFEKINYCERCGNSIFRNGFCESNPPGANRKEHYDYSCESECWLIRRSQNIKIFSDEFSNGLSITSLPIADVLLHTKQNISIEIQQFAISNSAYKYYKVLKDIIDNNGSFNAPPAAPFIGNIFNVDDEDEYVLGRFTASATTTRSIFIDRSSITEEAIEPLKRRLIESCTEVCPPSECLSGPCREIRTAPCTENHNRTSIKPQEWVD